MLNYAINFTKYALKKTTQKTDKKTYTKQPTGNIHLDDNVSTMFLPFLPTYFSLSLGDNREKERPLTKQHPLLLLSAR